MQNKKTFLILGLILLVSLCLLAVFIYTTQNQTYPTSAQPLARKTLVKEKSSEQNKPIDDKIQKIKQEMDKIKKQAITNSTNLEKNIVQEISTMKGIVLEKADSSLTIGFVKDSNHWTSKAILDSNSSIKIPTTDKNFKTGSLSDLKVGDKILVNALTSNLNTPEFKVSSIYLMN